MAAPHTQFFIKLNGRILTDGEENASIGSLECKLKKRQYLVAQNIISFILNS